jgi:hypothetical protein
VVGIATSVRPGIPDRANQNGPDGSPAQIEMRKLDVMLERGRTVSSGLWLRHPQLGQVHEAGRGMFLGVHHSMTGSHEIQLLRPDRLLAPETVPVEQFAGKHPGDRLKPDMGMRSNPGPAAWSAKGSGVIEKTPGADSSPAPLGQSAPYRQRADVGQPACHDLETADRVTGGGHRVSVAGCERSAHRDDLLVRNLARLALLRSARE